MQYEKTPHICASSRGLGEVGGGEESAADFSGYMVLVPDSCTAMASLHSGVAVLASLLLTCNYFRHHLFKQCSGFSCTERIALHKKMSNYYFDFGVERVLHSCVDQT